MHQNLKGLHNMYGWLSVAFWIAMFFLPLVSSLKLMNKKAVMEWRQMKNKRLVF